MNAGQPIDEYRIVCEFMRGYLTLRFLRFTVLLGATGGLIGTILSEAAKSEPHHVLLLKIGGLGLTLAFGAMDYSASVYWHQLRERANALAATLEFQPFPATSPWNPLTTTGASRFLHVFLVLLWLFVLLRGQGQV